MLCQDGFESCVLVASWLIVCLPVRQFVCLPVCQSLSVSLSFASHFVLVIELTRVSFLLVQIRAELEMEKVIQNRGLVACDRVWQGREKWSIPNYVSNQNGTRKVEKNICFQKLMKCFSNESLKFSRLQLPRFLKDCLFEFHTRLVSCLFAYRFFFLHFFLLHHL